MSEPFRLALVGAGMITAQSHLPAALASTLARVVAIVDPVQSRAEALARQYDLAVRVARRVEDVLTEIDGAVVATPNDSHHSIAIACLSAGVPTLIEKPLASSYANGVDIVHAGEQAGRIVAVGYATRFRDNVRLIKRLLDDEHFGRVRRFVHQFGSAGGWAPLSAYNLDRRAAGGGVLVVTGTHFLDRMLHFWGYPDRVALEDDSLGGPEANCTATFRYGNGNGGLTGTARYSKTVQLPGGMVIETDQGFVVLADSDEAEIAFRSHARPDLRQIVRAASAGQAPEDVFQRQIDDFIRAARGEKKPEVDGREGLESLQLIEALYASRRSIDLDPYAAGMVHH